MHANLEQINEAKLCLDMENVNAGLSVSLHQELNKHEVRFAYTTKNNLLTFKVYIHTQCKYPIISRANKS